VRPGIAQVPCEGRGVRGPGYRRKETAHEYATRTSGCVYLSVPGGLPYRRLTLMLRDLRAPGLQEVRGFCLPGEARRPVREGDAATRDDRKDDPMHDCHDTRLKRSVRAIAAPQENETCALDLAPWHTRRPARGIASLQNPLPTDGDYP
jgi:hypothetical protein